MISTNTTTTESETAIIPATTIAAVATIVTMPATVSTIRELKRKNSCEPWTVTGSDFEIKSNVFEYNV